MRIWQLRGAEYGPSRRVTDSGTITDTFTGIMTELYPTLLGYWSWYMYHDMIPWYDMRFRTPELLQEGGETYPSTPTCVKKHLYHIIRTI